MLRIGHYLNQFFAGIGAEERANHPPEVREGPVGPGRLLQSAAGTAGAASPAGTAGTAGAASSDGRVVSTLVCGDNFFNERAEEAHAAVRNWLDAVRPDLVVAGPAFAAGRYGSACAHVCRLAAERGIPAVTGMHPENPGVLVHKKAYVVPTTNSAGDMPRALPLLLTLGRKLVAGTVGPAAVEGYLPRGVRRPGLRDTPGAERAVDMLVAKLTGRPFVTEIPVDAYEAVSPAPALQALDRATIGLVVSSGIVPRGNPDHFRRCSETRWQRYELAGLAAASPQAFECVHGGFFNQMATDNPNLALPLDVARDLEREGVIGRLLDHYYATVGNDQRFLDCKRNGAEIAAALRRDGADGVLLVAT